MRVLIPKTVLRIREAERREKAPERGINKIKY
jgi:hypothetical protein